MTTWKRKQVVVTGAAGFIGSHLTEKLVEEGARVRALVHYNSRNHRGNLEDLGQDVLKDLDVVMGDLTDPFCVESAVRNAEVVFHLGALIAIPYSYIAPWQFVYTNVLGTVNVLEACRKHGVERLVHTSTSEVYGTALYTPIDERHPLQAQSPYSASKISGDKMAESYHRSYGIPVVTVRPFNTFGPRQSGRAVIPTIISQALVEDTIRLGALTPMRDLSFVTDTVEGFLAVAGSEGVTGEVVNIGRGEAIAIGDLARMILDILGKKDAQIVSDEKRLRPESSEVYELVCDNRKARDLCSWFPRRGLREGLEETIGWIEKNLDRMKAGSYTI